MERMRQMIASHGGDAGLLLLRVWFGLVMAFGHGWGKVTELSKFHEAWNAVLAKKGMALPEFLATCAAVFELAGGILIALGLLFRTATVALLGTMLGAAFIFHSGDAFGKREYALAFVVICLAFLLTGPGRYSVSAWLKSRSSGTPADAP